ncbi:hypothetical protein ACFPH6_26605 [Streptomyces xiangluensis]|uniref:Major facilitator superfamily (MFS) profile domain-containing protein n=1 Tax=Streptomyces xiangluensis TaxID=2665720 RepID=A0ABV8YVY7_9ACTN
MSSTPTADVRESRQPRSSSWVGTAVCAVVLALGTLVTGYVVLTAYMIEPDGPWDRQAVTNSSVAASIGLAFSGVTALLTWLFVKATWLRKWWYAIPTVLVIAALLRLTVLAPKI